MKLFHQLPFFRISLLWISGILISLYLSDLYVIKNILLIVFIVLLFLLVFINMKIKFSWSLIFGLISAVALVFGAALLTHTYRGNWKQVYQHVSNEKCDYIIQLESDPVERSKTWRFDAVLLARYNVADWEKAEGKILCYLKKDSVIPDLCYGDRLLISEKILEITKPVNPEEFNYKRYLANHGVFHQVYLKPEQYQIIGNHFGNKLLSFGLSSRKMFVEILRENALSGNDLSIASAILLGYDELLQAEIKEDFSGAGAMHILCVSGLHVGVIFLILNYLLWFLNKKKYQRSLKVIIIIVVIWLYALITGFSPSVLRASTMFSFISLGMLFKRDIKTLNLVFASAFFLLLINPFYLFELGFQLSYLAVLGIILLYPELSKLWIPRNWLLRQIWSIFIVSIIAQIATFPIAVFYFHQFPNLFIVTNFVAIPSASIILYLGILLFVLTPFGNISAWIGKVLSMVTTTLLRVIEYINHFDFSTSSDIYFSGLQVGFIYWVFVLFFAWILMKNRRLFLGILAGILLLLALSSVRLVNKKVQEKIVFYGVQGHTAINYLKGRKNILVCDSSLFSQAEKINYHIRPYWIRYGAAEPEFIFFEDEIISDDIRNRSGFLLIKDQLIYAPQESISSSDNLDFGLDYLLVRNNCKGIEKLLGKFDVNEIIIDQSVSLWDLNKMEEALEFYKESTWIIKERGAKIVRIR